MAVPSADKNIYGNSRMHSPVEVNSLLPSNSNSNHHSFPRGAGKQNNTKNHSQRIPSYSLKEVNFVQELGEGAFGKYYLLFSVTSNFKNTSSKIRS